MNSKFLLYGTLIVLHTGLLSATVKEITCLDEYKRVRNASKPTVIIFNSSSCSACTQMEPFMEAASEHPDYQGADFYSVNGQEKDFKDTLKSEKIQAYPTTLFIKPGEEPRRERGGMSEKEVLDITYEFIHDKKRPQPPVKKASVNTKKEK